MHGVEEHLYGNVIAPDTTFEAWAAINGLTPSTTLFDADTDQDGIPNGIEALFGTNPNEQSSEGLNILSIDSGALTFSHPQSLSNITDLSVHYEWSQNLQDWYEADGIDGPGNGLVLTAAPITTDVTTTVDLISSEVLETVFIRIRVEQN